MGFELEAMTGIKQDGSMQQLLDCIQTTPVIDHHAHNILLPSEQESHPLLSITTEANGEALQHTPSTLAHMRAVRQLADILECEPTWNTVQSHLQKKRREDSDSWAKLCFRGIETVLIDDGLDTNTVYPYNWHDRLTRSPCKRIVRIEKIAEAIMTRWVEFFQARREQDRPIFNVRESILEEFSLQIEKAIGDPEVAGFKSVICYRTGLAIPHFDQLDFERGMDALLDDSETGRKLIRLEDDVLNPGFVHITAQTLVRCGSRKPFQFHTGLGDNDIRLRFSSPSHLQSFIEAYPSVPVVLLHASYPFTTEAGYLASTYPNVYLDIGEVFPMVSQEGQEIVIRQALELCPSQKLTWSTDGHWFPETYLLAVKQIRQALEKVMREYVISRILTVPEAIMAVQDLLFCTSSRLYDLKLDLKPLKEVTTMNKLPGSHPSRSTSIEGIEALERMMSEEPTVKYLRLQWVDYTATVRVRIIPIRQALDLFSQGKGVSVTKAVLGLLQTDAMAAGVRSVGQYQLYPTFSSLCLGARPGYAMVQCEFRDDGNPLPTCPRTCLRTTVERARDHGIEFLVGFEIEVVFLYSGPEGTELAYKAPRVTTAQSWSSARALQDNQMMNLLESIMSNLERAGIGIQQFHPETAPGQYEFVMDPMEPLAAVDSLICARDIIATVASKFNMRATLVPKVFPSAAGSGEHVHVSMTPPEKHQHFLAGLLKHLNGILALTYPNAASYERVSDSTWSGAALLGTWIAWGTQNRETPIRYISGSRYEIKCVDGFANPFLALGAILGSGLRGILDTEPLKHGDCLDDPAYLTTDDRRALGITSQMPRSIAEALRYFRDSATLRDILGDAAFENYLVVKEAEVEMLDEMEMEERRQWLIERY
ncbi:MAG: hypothetical protein Q9181_006170 [Wetmoreana brouardii]